MLTLTTTPSSNVSQTLPVTSLSLPLTITVTESDTTLNYRNLYGYFQWSDIPGVYEFGNFGGFSSPAYTYTQKAAGIVSLNATRTVAPGLYICTIYAQNYRYPVPDVAQTVLQFRFITTSAPGTYTPSIYGFILPLDNQSPNTSNWDLNYSSDVNIVASSIKMLLLTAIGERVMEPTYGTNIRDYIFDPNIQGINAVLTSSISQAVALWVPQVSVLSINVTTQASTYAIMTANFLYKPTNSTFTVTSTITP